ncbi:hypothetical protein Hanom_Chr17g01576721 [Helianthus anomalus]
MVDAEVDPKGFMLVGDSIPLSYNFDDIIRRVQIEQRKRKAKEPEVMLLRWKEKEKEVEEEEKINDEELKDILDDIDNFDPANDSDDDDDDDDDQGSTRSTNKRRTNNKSLLLQERNMLTRFLTLPTIIYLNAPVEGEIEVPRSRAEMLKELSLDDGKFKFDIEYEIRSSPEKEFEFKYVHEADNYNDVIVEEGSDS